MQRKSMAAYDRKEGISRRLITGKKAESVHKQLKNNQSSKAVKIAENISVTTARSPILTRSRSKAIALQNSKIIQPIEHCLRSASHITPADNLETKLSNKREHLSSAEKAEKGLKKQKLSIPEGKRPYNKSVMNEIPSASKSKSRKSSKSDSTFENETKIDPSDMTSIPGVSKESVMEIKEEPKDETNTFAGINIPSFSGRYDNFSTSLRDAAFALKEKKGINIIQGSAMDSSASNQSKPFVTYSRLAQAEAAAQHVPHCAQGNENEMSLEGKMQQYDLLYSKEIPERKSITKSDLQKSLSAIQMKRNSHPSKRILESQAECKPSLSSASSSHNILNIKAESDASLLKDRFKFNKTSKLSSSIRQSFLKGKTPAPCSDSVQGSSCHNVVKEEVDMSSTEEIISNPFLSDNIFMNDITDSASSSCSIDNTDNAATEDSESADSEIGHLQALLESRRIPLCVFGALGHRMQHLFNKSMGTATNNRVHQIVQGLRAADDGQQLQAVIELCQMLVMGNEDTLIGFPVKQVVPILINLLSIEHNFELMNQACRALTYLMEALPRSSSVVVEAIPALLNKLQVIQCMDVAEQSLTALEMLSKWHNKSILHAKGVATCLMYFEFFSINAQRAALSVTANCCRNILYDEFSLVQDSLHMLSGWLTHQDEKLVESICLAFSRLVDSFQNDSEHLLQIGSHSLLSNIQQLLIVSPSIIGPRTFTAVIRMLALLCSSCAEVVVFLLKQNFSETVRYLLIGTYESTSDIELIARSPQELFEISSLICEIMPCLPVDGIFSIDSIVKHPKIQKQKSLQDSMTWQWKDQSGVWHSYEKNASRIIELAYLSGESSVSLSGVGGNHLVAGKTSCTIDLNLMQQLSEDSSSSRPLRRNVNRSSDSVTGHEKLNTRADFFEANTDLVLTSIKTLFPVLYEMYCSSAGPAVKHKCLRAMLRMVFYSPADDLKLILKNQMLSRHIAAMLASQDFRVVVSALQLSEILMLKLTDDFRVHFVREGVMHEVRLLAKIDVNSWPKDASCDSSPSSPSISRVHNDCSSDKLNCFTEREQSSSTSVASLHEGAQSTVLRKADGSSSSSSLSRFSDVLKRQYMIPKLAYGSGWKETFSALSSSYTISPESKKKINIWIKEQSHSFDNKYFSTDELRSHPVINVLHQLSDAVGQLELMADCGLEALTAIRSIVVDSDISSFELIHSGLVSKLKMYLTVPEHAASPFGAYAHECRLRTFLHVFIGSPLVVDPGFDTTKLEPSPLSSLISKLNECVSHLEQFAVQVHDQVSNGNTDIQGTSSLKVLNMGQLKCYFQRHPECSNLRQWRNGPVMIDPLASIQNIDKYLVSQGFGVLKDEDDDDDDSDQSFDDSSDEDTDEIMTEDVEVGQGQGIPKLQFMIGKNILPHNMTVYQAVRQYGCSEGRSSDVPDLDIIGYTNIWLRTHTIYYRPFVPEEAEASCVNDSPIMTRSKAEKKKKMTPVHSSQAKDVSEESGVIRHKKDTLWEQGTVPEATSPLSIISNLTETNKVQDPSLEVICLLKVIHTLSCHWGSLYQVNAWEPAVSQMIFINNKLTVKVNRQLRDPLAIITGNVPAWLSQIAYSYPFLFPFETRYLLFYITSFDRDRALNRLLDTVPEVSNTEKITPRLEKKKATVSRDGLLKQAEVLLQESGNSKALLEIQYKNEVGTGLGPTLEFYALVSRQLQRADFDMWRGESITSNNEKGQPMNYVHNPSGLFPVPLPRNVKGSLLTRICNKFKLLGNLLAKAVMDSRLLDVPLSLAFYKLMLNQESYLCLFDLLYVDESLAQTVFKLEKIVTEKKMYEKDITPVDIKSALEKLTFDGCSVKDLNLDFTLPGYSSIEMKKGGKDITVSLDNLEEYLKLLKHWTMREGVHRQMQAFKEGFESVFPLKQLQVFYPDELAFLFCGNEHSQWDMKSLMECCRPDHGYTHDSRAIKFLFDVLCSYDTVQQRQFLQFVTGSPRLPVGGLKSLSPALTVVRKTSDGDDNPDSYLPSVMTCVNYLKLPDYSSVEIMRMKLHIAISEGQYSFHLS